MKTTYIIENSVAFVNTWNPTFSDWSGPCFAKYPISENKKIETENLTLQQVTDAITELLYLDDDYLIPANLSITENSVTVSIIEGANSEPDPDGAYLVDYSFTIKKELSENELEALFNAQETA